MNAQQIDIEEQDLTWAQLHDLSGGLLLESGSQIIDDGADLLSLIQQLYGECDKKRVGNISTSDLLLGMRIAEGLIRTGNGIIKHYDQQEEAKQ